METISSIPLPVLVILVVGITTVICNLLFSAAGLLLKKRIAELKMLISSEKEIRTKVTRIKAEAQADFTNACKRADEASVTLKEARVLLDEVTAREKSAEELSYRATKAIDEFQKKYGNILGDS